MLKQSSVSDDLQEMNHLHLYLTQLQDTLVMEDVFNCDSSSGSELLSNCRILDINNCDDWQCIHIVYQKIMSIIIY
jgi:hypothetical protein